MCLQKWIAASEMKYSIWVSDGPLFSIVLNCGKGVLTTGFQWVYLRVSAHMHFVFLQNFVKSSFGRIFAKDLRFCEQLLRKIKVNTIAEEGRTWKKGSKSSPLLCNFLRQIQFLNFKIWTSQEACCLSYYLFKYKPNFTKFCTDTKPVSANSLRRWNLIADEDVRRDKHQIWRRRYNTCFPSSLRKESGTGARIIYRAEFWATALHLICISRHQPPFSTSLIVPGATMTRRVTWAGSVKWPRRREIRKATEGVRTTAHCASARARASEPHHLSNRDFPEHFSSSGRTTNIMFSNQINFFTLDANVGACGSRRVRSSPRTGRSGRQYGRSSSPPPSPPPASGSSSTSRSTFTTEATSRGCTINFIWLLSLTRIYWRRNITLRRTSFLMPEV